MSGIDYQRYIQLRDNLIHVRDDVVDKEIRAACRQIAKRFIKAVEKRTPVDTGLLKASWEYELEKNGTQYTIWVWNTAKSKNGSLYMEWVEDGHRVRLKNKEWRRVKIGNSMRLKRRNWRWVEGRFFLKLTETEIRNELPKVIKNVEQRIARAILNGL